MTHKSVLIDFHVHIHDIYNPEKFFNSAFDNFIYFAKKNGLNFKTGYLFLTEITGFNYFEKLSNGKISLTSFDIVFPEEKISLMITNKLNQKIYVVSGRQIVTKEKIEILALGTGETFADGNSLSSSFSEILSSGALPKLPWGVGKWLGKRKQILEEFILENSGKKFVLGDNSGRPVFWPKSNLFKLAENKNIPVLRGTDPLNIPADETKAGSFGNILTCEIDPDYPAKSVLEAVKKMSSSPTPYGRLENPFSFIRNQIQLRKTN